MMTEQPKEQKHLGKGLAALLGDESQDYASLDKVRQLKQVPIETLIPSKVQPRQTFEEEALKALADSIRSKGILQPIVVRRQGEHSKILEIIAGERRWRAAQMAQLHEVPVIIKDLNDQDALHIALIENIQRQDLNPVEEAQAYKRLIDEFSHTQEAIAQAVGKSRSYIANSLRLLSLKPFVQELIASGQLTPGHARTLVTSDFPDILAQQIIDRKLTVREAEKLAKSKKTGGKAQPKQKKDADTLALEKDVSDNLGMKAVIRSKRNNKGGTLTLHYKTLDQLDHVLRILRKKVES